MCVLHARAERVIGVLHARAVHLTGVCCMPGLYVLQVCATCQGCTSYRCVLHARAVRLTGVCYFPGLYVLWLAWLGEERLKPGLAEAGMVLTFVNATLDPLIYGWRMGKRQRWAALYHRCQCR